MQSEAAESQARRGGARKVVVVSTDTGFCMPTAVTLWSLDQHGGGPFDIKVLHDAVAAEPRAKVSASVGSEGSTIEWIDLGELDVPSKRPLHLPRAATFRLMLDRIELPEVDRVLYLDTDTLIMSSLDPLWEIDLGDHTIGAVRCVNKPNIATYGAIDRWKDLGLDPRLPFFNSGVLLIDVERWSDRRVGERAIDYMTSEFASGNSADQEALNAVLAGDWYELGPGWNQQTPLLADNRGAPLMYSDDVLDDARENPKVIHYLDRPKPWHRDSVHPLRHLWRDAASRTSFAPIALDKKTLADDARWRIKRAAHALIKGR